MCISTLIFPLNFIGSLLNISGALIMFRNSQPSFGEPTFEDAKKRANKFFKEKRWFGYGMLILFIGFVFQLAALIISHYFPAA